ncbi:uncharacterized protein DS421_18g629200 [Arachis hypogaea]|nr:uncharacterized protein DS421_18g629200 [Arachis hypogaea]
MIEMDGLVGCGKCQALYPWNDNVVVVFLLYRKSVPGTISSEQEHARRYILGSGKKATSERVGDDDGIAQRLGWRRLWDTAMQVVIHLGEIADMVTERSMVLSSSSILDDSLSSRIGNTLFSSSDAAHRDRSSTSCVIDIPPVHRYRFAAITDATPSRFQQRDGGFIQDLH